MQRVISHRYVWPFSSLDPLDPCPPKDSILGRVEDVRTILPRSFSISGVIFPETCVCVARLFPYLRRTFSLSSSFQILLADFTPDCVTNSYFLSYNELPASFFQRSNSWIKQNIAFLRFFFLAPFAKCPPILFPSPSGRGKKDVESWSLKLRELSVKSRGSRDPLILQSLFLFIEVSNNGYKGRRRGDPCSLYEEGEPVPPPPCSHPAFPR